MRLFKPKSSDFWHVEVMCEDQSTKSVNTWCRTKKEAEALAKQANLAELEAAAGAHRLTAEVVSLIVASRTISVAEAIEEWATWMKTGVRSNRTRENNYDGSKLWAREMGIDQKSISLVTTDDIHNWINRPDNTDKRGTRLLKLAAVRGLMRFCCIKRWILSDPSQLVVVDMRMMDHDQRETKHKAVFTDDEVEFLLAKCSGAEPGSDEGTGAISAGFYRAAIILGRDLGLRLGDICNLEVNQFDFSTKTLSAWLDKTNARIEIPLTQRVIRLVASLPEQDKKYLFPNERKITNDPKRRALLSVYFGRFFASNGFKGYSFHSLRATLSTTMANQGATMEEIAERLGHKGAKVTNAYVKNPGSSRVARR